jgi:alkylation response protein AidB-like acyl-CoA dehydrogenase
VVIDLARADRSARDSLDIINPAGALRLNDCAAIVAAQGDHAARLWARIMDRAAILLAFAQVGGADAALRAACAHVTQRFAFGRPLGSFQAIKHGLADVLAAIEIARSNAWYAAATLVEDDRGGDGAALAEAAAAARISATDAHRQAARAYVHYLGGVGVTEESDGHLHYRKAQALGMKLGSPALWRERLMQALLARRPQLSEAA